MGSNARVINLTTGARIKRSQARGRVENCMSVWVVEGFTIRDLTLAQIVQRRSIQARLQESIPFAELPGLIFKPAQKDQASTRISYALLKQANQFCQAHA